MTCPSWLHDEPVPTLTARRTCAAHLDEEPHILRIEGEFERVAAQVRAYEHVQAKRDLEPAGSRAIHGFRHTSERGAGMPSEPK